MNSNRSPLVISAVLVLTASAICIFRPEAYLFALAPWAAGAFFLGIHFIVNMKVEPLYKLPEDHDDGN